MDTEKLNQAQEAVYLVDRAVLLHLKEVQGGDFEYAAFDKRTKEKVAEGKIMKAEVLNGIDCTHDHLAAARNIAMKGTGLDGIEVAQVGLTSLKAFHASDIYRRSIWDQETLPKTDIRFINSGYDEQFRIPDGGTIQVEYPDRIFSAKCEYIDDCHTRISGDVYHICQFAEILERNEGVYRPEPMMEADRAAWIIGRRTYLTVKCSRKHWEYHLFDDKMAELKSGKIKAVGLSVNKVRDIILAENKMDGRSLKSTSYNVLTEMVSVREQSEGPARKPSVRGQLAAANAAQAEKPAAQQRQKHKEVR